MSVFFPQISNVLFGEFDQSKIVLTSEKVESKHYLEDLFWSIYFKKLRKPALFFKRSIWLQSSVEKNSMFKMIRII